MAITIDGTGSISGLSATGISAQPVFPGNILQVVSTTKTDTFSTTSGVLVDVTGLNVSITPTASSSKVLVLVNLALSQPSGQTGSYQLVRGSTEIAKGTATATFQRTGFAVYDGTGDIGLIATSISYLDSPSTTSATTYKIQISSGGNTMGLNRRGADTVYSAVSSITVMEVAA